MEIFYFILPFSLSAQQQHCKSAGSNLQPAAEMKYYRFLQHKKKLTLLARTELWLVEVESENNKK